MKLREFIEKLQECERSNPDMEASLQIADVGLNGHTLRTIYFFEGFCEPTQCQLTFGYDQEQAAEFLEQAKMLRENG